jgi:protein SCO1/2
MMARGHVVMGFVLLLACTSAFSSESAVPDKHAAHRAAMQNQRYAATTENYAIPDVELIDQLGKSVSLRTILEADQPVALNFIFTTCTTICPVMTATFAQMRRELGEAGDQLRLVSISIDPEYDRPETLKAYAEQFRAGAGWDFLTGDSEDIVRVLKSFDSYAGSKMNHQPVTLLKRPGSSSWTRIDGLASGKDLADEVAARLLN